MISAFEAENLWKVVLGMVLTGCVMGCAALQSAWKPGNACARFSQVRVESADENFLTTVVQLENLSKKTIELPHIAFDRDQIGSTGSVSYRVLRNGKWVNPGIYYDAVPVWTELQPGQRILLRVRIPLRLIQIGDTFCLGVGRYFSLPFVLDAVGGMRPLT